MPTVNIRGIPVNFPFQPYDIQTVYMEKVIECLQNEQNGVLESPTGTGKTLSLLCSSLAWLTMKKAQIQAQRQAAILPNECEYLDKINSELGAPTSSNAARTNFAVMPTIIYASRTHSQLTQVMQELKRSAYNYVRSTVIGSRDQMCLHPEISKEPNQVKVKNYDFMLCNLLTAIHKLIYLIHDNKLFKITNFGCYLVGSWGSISTLKP